MTYITLKEGGRAKCEGAIDESKATHPCIPCTAAKDMLGMLYACRVCCVHRCDKEPASPASASRLPPAACRLPTCSACANAGMVGKKGRGSCWTGIIVLYQESEE
jgi:hypothetical protein